MALASGTARELRQDEAGATQAPKLSREIAKLEWDRPAEELARRVRGLYPWPGCRVAVCDAEGTELGRIRLVRARASQEDEGTRWTPGEVMGNGFVRAGAGALEIVECQPEGKRSMPLADYRRGHRWQPGLRLKSIL